MDVSGTGPIQFGSDPEFDEFHTLYRNSLYPDFPASRDALRAWWEILPASERQLVLLSLRVGVRTGGTRHAGLGAFPTSAVVPHAYNGTGLTFLIPYSSDIANSLYGPNYQRDINVTSNRFPGFAADIQSYSPRPAALLNNPPGQGGVIIAPTELTREHQAIGNAPNRQRAFSHPDYADRIRFYSPGPVAPGHDGFSIILADIDDGNWVTRILPEARATGDARYTKMFKTLVPVSVTNAYKAGKILKSIYHGTLPLSIKISGFFTVSSAIVAVLSSLAGFSLSTLKPNTLPFGCNPQCVMEIMHDVGVYSTAYAFIWTMGHEFLQDDPFIMFPAAGLASAAFTGLMTFIGRRVGQGTFRAGGDFAAV